MHVRDLTPDELQTLGRDGFVLVPNVFVAPDLRPLHAACERLEVMAQELFAQGARGPVLHRGSQFVLGEIATGRRCGQVRIERVVWAGAAARRPGFDTSLSMPISELRALRVSACPWLRMWTTAWLALSVGRERKRPGRRTSFGARVR